MHGVVKEGIHFKELLLLYKKYTGMEVNIRNCVVAFNEINEETRQALTDYFPFSFSYFNDG